MRVETFDSEVPHPMDEHTGFPFEDRPRTGSIGGGRSDAFQHRLDDIASRYPEFADHFEGAGASFRTPFWHQQQRRGSGGSTGSGGGGGSGSGASGTRPDLHERFAAGAGDPFDDGLSGFGRDFGYPFDTFYRPRHHYEQQQHSQPDPHAPPSTKPPVHPNAQHHPTSAQPPPQQQQQSHTAAAPQSADSSCVDGANNASQQQQAQSAQAQSVPIQQSNTVDLGQKQPPAVAAEDRAPRSMSAPPDPHRQQSGTAAPARYVSSLLIPNLKRPSEFHNNNNNPPAEMGAMYSSSTTAEPVQPPPAEPPQPSAQQHRPNERVIPIHVEGRDEPVIPKNAHIPPQQQQQQQSDQQQQPSQPDRIFGQRPSTFTKFVNKPAAAASSATPLNAEALRQQQELYQREQAQRYQQQQQQEQQQNAPPQAAQLPPQAQQAPVKPTPLDLIQEIQKDVQALMARVERFEGKPRDKEYMFLDEMLTRNLLRLDNIETEGKDVIRQARKEAIRCIEGCIGILEAKANANAAAAAAAAAASTATTTGDQPVQTAAGDAVVSGGEDKPTTESTLVTSGVARSGSVIHNPSNEAPSEEAAPTATNTAKA